MSAAVSQPVADYIDGLDNPQRKAECTRLLEIFARATGLEAALWSSAMIGYGRYHYRYESGREGDWFLTGFAPRKGALTIYIMPGFERYEALREAGVRSCIMHHSLAGEAGVRSCIMHHSLAAQSCWPWIGGVRNGGQSW